MRALAARHRPTPAMVVAVIALVVACTGSAVAASLITGNQIARNTITGKNVKNKTITLSDISAKTQAALAGSGTGAAGKDGKDGKDLAPGGDVPVVAPSSIWEEKRGAKITPAGATLGPFVDNAQLGDAVIFHGYDGKPLKDVAQLAYSASYHHDPGEGDDNGDAPYMLMTLNGTDHTIVFSPSTQQGACYGPDGGATSPQCNSSDRTIHYEVSKGTVRYDDDPGAGPDNTWDKIVSEHGDDVISGIRVQAGNSLPGTESALVNSLTVEAKGEAPTTFFFGL